MEKLKRPRGRPPIPDPATARIDLRVTPAEKAKYQRAADRAKVALSAWLKALADREAG
jgi:molecular chaperone DnaK (HSP70)